MVTDLHTKLRTAIEARLALAERASDYLFTGERWRFDSSSSTGPRLIVGGGDDGVWEREVNSAVWTCDDEEDGCPDEARSWSAEGRHMAANDPAFTIRACRADLDRLEDHQRELKPGSWCDECSQAWPCSEIRRLAEVYAVEVDE